LALWSRRIFTGGDSIGHADASRLRFAAVDRDRDRGADVRRIVVGAVTSSTANRRWSELARAEATALLRVRRLGCTSSAIGACATALRRETLVATDLAREAREYDDRIDGASKNDERVGRAHRIAAAAAVYVTHTRVAGLGADSDRERKERVGRYRCRAAADRLAAVAKTGKRRAHDTEREKTTENS
jgi:hypothetical protein